MANARCVSGSSRKAFCGQDRRRLILIAVSAWKGYTRKDGTRKRHFYYACAPIVCSYSRPPNARKIETEAWEEVKAMQLDPERLKRGLDGYLEATKGEDRGPREESTDSHEQDR